MPGEKKQLRFRSKKYELYVAQQTQKKYKLLILCYRDNYEKLITNQPFSYPWIWHCTSTNCNAFAL